MDRNDTGVGSSRKYYWKQRHLKPILQDPYSSSTEPASVGRRPSNFQTQWIPLEDKSARFEYNDRGGES